MQFQCQREPRLAYSIHNKPQHDHGCISSGTDRYQRHSMRMTGSGQPPLNQWLRVPLTEKILNKCRLLRLHLYSIIYQGYELPSSISFYGNIF